MKHTIRSFQQSDLAAVVDLSLAAWAPIFASFAEILGPEIYDRLYPDWRQSQSEGVSQACTEMAGMTVWVAEVADQVIGFIACTMDHQEKTGEVYLLAVHPDYQNRGIGTDLNNFVLEKMKASGMRLAVVGTGGDPAHAPARQSYEKAGYTPLPLVRYYKDL